MDSHVTDLETLREQLAGDPANLGRARAYWDALGPLRSGWYVVVAFGDAAKTGPEGARGFARAYRELFEESGEGPRSAYVDGELLDALRGALRRGNAREMSDVRWLVESVERKRYG